MRSRTERDGHRRHQPGPSLFFPGKGLVYPIDSKVPAAIALGYLLDGAAS